MTDGHTGGHTDTDNHNATDDDGRWRLDDVILLILLVLWLCLAVEHYLK